MFPSIRFYFRYSPMLSQFPCLSQHQKVQRAPKRALEVLHAIRLLRMRSNGENLFNFRYSNTFGIDRPRNFQNFSIRSKIKAVKNGKQNPVAGWCFVSSAGLIGRWTLCPLIGSLNTTASALEFLLKCYALLWRFTALTTFATYPLITFYPSPTNHSCVF